MIHANRDLMMNVTTRRRLIRGTALPSSFDGIAVREHSHFAPPVENPARQQLDGPQGRKAGWAIVGLGRLALAEIMPAFATCKRSTPVALVSGDREKALKVARAHGIAEDAIYDYDNFDRIAGDPRIVVVYIVLPNSMHAEYTTRALRAGKHVLCEKPMAVTVEEGVTMEQAANEAGKKLGIAYRLHYEPMNRKVMDWCREKKFGRVKAFTSSNCQTVEASNIRLSGKLGGGPLVEVGIHPINAARYVLNEEPAEITAYACRPESGPRFREVPESVTFVMRYPSGAIASCLCSFGVSESRQYRVHCEKGFIDMDPASSCGGLRPRTSRKHDGLPKPAEFMTRPVNHFTREMDGFSAAVLDDAEVTTPASMGIADMRIVTAIGESILRGEPVNLGA